MLDNRRLFELAIVDNDGNRIVLGNVTRGTMSENTQMNILKNLIMDESGNVRMRDSKSSFVIWNVNYNDVGNEETTAKNNMSDIYDDDIIDFSKDSLEYTIKGVVINAPFTLAGESNYYREKVQNTKQVSNPATEIPEGNTIKEGNSVVDTNTGAVVEGPTKVVEEAKEQKPIGAVRDRRRKKPSTTKPKVERIIPNKCKGGVFEGANMSVNEINEALNAQGITTEEQWNNRTDEEMERVLQCCGAI